MEGLSESCLVPFRISANNLCADYFMIFLEKHKASDWLSNCVGPLYFKRIVTSADPEWGQELDPPDKSQVPIGFLSSDGMTLQEKRLGPICARGILSYNSL